MATSEPVQESLMLDYSQPSKPRVLLAASGSVAAIKFESLCRSFSEWADVRAVATKSSLHFVDRSSLPSGIALYTDDDEWSTWKKIGDEVLHIELRKWADILVIAPLSANTLAKVSCFCVCVNSKLVSLNTRSDARFSFLYRLPVAYVTTS